MKHPTNTLRQRCGLVLVAGMMLCSCNQAYGDMEGVSSGMLDGDVHADSIADREIYVPNTISAAARDLLLTGKEAKAYKRIFPAADDTAAWRLVRNGMEARSADDFQKVVDVNEVTVSDTLIGGVSVLDIRPHGWKDNQRIVVFFHGGAFTLHSARSTIAHSAPVARAGNLRIISVDYAKAPFVCWKQIQQQGVDVFRALLARGYRMKHIGICGASAGGGLATSIVLNLRDEGMGTPGACVLWSPWVDLTKDGDTQHTLEDQDPILLYEGLLDRSADAYAQGLDLRDPRVSPLYADFKKGFSPTMIQEGTKTVFLSTSIRLYQRLDEAGNKPVIDMYEGMVHVFQQFPLPEADYAIRKTAAFFNAHLK
jgi:monoterpene epsilon-lactone hydrolase